MSSSNPTLSAFLIWQSSLLAAIGREMARVRLTAGISSYSEALKGAGVRLAHQRKALSKLSETNAELTAQSLTPSFQVARAVAQLQAPSTAWGEMTFRALQKLALEGARLETAH